MLPMLVMSQIKNIAQTDVAFHFMNFANTKKENLTLKINCLTGLKGTESGHGDTHSAC